jgi:hypothetical protein
VVEGADEDSGQELTENGRLVESLEEGAAKLRGDEDDRESQQNRTDVWTAGRANSQHEARHFSGE